MAVELPDVVDLLALAVRGGLEVGAALSVVAPSCHPDLRPGLRTVADSLSKGASTEEAVLTLMMSWGPAASGLVHGIVDHLRYGTPLTPALSRIGSEVRMRRRRAAEIRARRLPVLLLFPLVLCTLPAFALLTVTPLVAGTFGSLDVTPLEAPASTTP